MPTSNRDRNFSTLEYSRTPWPLPPLNLFCTSGWEPGVYDIRWDDPGNLTLNQEEWEIVGVNLYRSFDSEFGPYYRVSQMPVGASFWRDRTDNELVVDEVVEPTRWLSWGAPGSEGDVARFVFRTLHGPIVRPGSQGVAATSPDEVQVFVNGRPARVLRVDGFVGEVHIDARAFVNVSEQNYDLPVVPTTSSDVVTVSYRYGRSLLKTDLAQRVFYRACSVGYRKGTVPMTSDDLQETPLENAVHTSNYEVEKLDYIWAEAVRRNRWILEQGGERVRVFLRKNVGPVCPCIPDTHHKQPQSDCLVCYGSGVRGGFEGPYETIMAPDDAERRIAQKDIGRTVEHTYEVWCGPVPLLSQRDFLVKLNGDRYSIGPVRMPTNRGMVLQQHFNIGHLDEQDIRYKVPMGDPLKFPRVGFGPQEPEQGGPTPITDNTDTEDSRELRGRTLAWVNTMYGGNSK